MSPPPSTPIATSAPTVSAAQSMVRIGIRAQAVMGMLGYTPTIMLAALAERNYDTVSHHRSSVLKNHGLPNRTKGRRMLGANLRRQVRRRDNPQTIADTQGEGFAVTLRGQVQNGKPWGDFLENLELGATIDASEWMAIPMTTKVAGFRRLLAAGKLMVGPRGLLMHSVGGKRARTEFQGVLRRTRDQRPMLGYYRQWDSVVADELPEYERDLDRVLTEAGRARLERTITIHRSAREAFRTEFARFLADNPGRHAEARKAAVAVAKEVRRAGKARKV